MKDKRTAKKTQKLLQSIQRGKNTVVVEGSLAKEVIRLKAVGKTVWNVAVRAIRIVEATIKQTIPLGPMNVPFYVVGMGVAGMALGSLAITAIGIAIITEGIDVLIALRDKYDIRSQAGNKIILVRKQKKMNKRICKKSWIN